MSNIWNKYTMNDASPVQRSAAGALFAIVEEEPKDLVVLISSIFTHLVAGLIIFGVVHDPVTVTNAQHMHYTLRSIELHMPVPVIAPHSREIEKHPLQQAAHGDLKAPASLKTQSEPLQDNHSQLQKVLQIAKDRSVATEDSPHPLVLLSAIKESPAPIIQASPELIPASSDRTPKPELFTEDATLSDVLIKPVAQANTLNIRATTSTPIRIQANAPQRIFLTANTDSDKKATANIVVLSQMRMPQGTVVLPRIQSSEPTVSRAHSNGDARAHSMSTSGSETISVQRIQFPPAGHFSMVMIGNSLEEQYPETASIWSGRLAYTVYLQLGAGRKWILQYSPSSSEAATGSENGGRPEAPWPTDIVVPTLSPDNVNSDAILVHGALTATGHFKDLVISFPPYLSTASFVLDTLSKWVFRPATQNGRNVAVDVLLIIPIS